MNNKICFISLTYLEEMRILDLIEITRSLSGKGICVDIIVLGDGTQKRINHNLYLYKLKSGNKWYNRRLTFFRAANRIIRKNSYSAIHVYYFPLVAVLRLISPWKKSAWILDIRTVAIQSGIHGLFRNILCGIESLFFDYVAIISKDIAKSLFFVFRNGRRTIELPTGVNPELFVSVPFTQRSELRERSEYAGKNLLIYVGKMDKTRKLSQMIEAFSIVVGKCTFDNTVFLMIGDGDDRENLESIARDKGLADKIIFKGHTPYETVNHYLSLSDVALSYIPINKVYNNQPPLKTLEYLSNGIPQVATSTKGNRRYIKDHVNGILSDDSPQAFSEGIEALLGDMHLREEISRKCSSLLEKNYWDRIVEEVLIPLYKQIEASDI